jgi:hypothetical protein
MLVLSVIVTGIRYSPRSSRHREPANGHNLLPQILHHTSFSL